MAKSTLILDNELFARAINRLRKDASGRDESAQKPSDQEIAQALSQFCAPNKPQALPTEPARPQTDAPPPERAQETPSRPAISRSNSAEETGNSDDTTGSNKSRSKWIAGRWTVAGFVLGIAFWHVVGFWDFVSTVVLDHEHLAANKAANQLRPSVRPKSAPPKTAPAISLAAAQKKHIRPTTQTTQAMQATQITTGSLPRQTSRLTAATPNAARVAQLKRVLAGAPLLREPCLTLVKAAPGGSAWTKPCAPDNAEAAALTLRPASSRVDRLELLERLDDRIKQPPILSAIETAPKETASQKAAPTSWSIVIKKR